MKSARDESKYTARTHARSPYTKHFNQSSPELISRKLSRRYSRTIIAAAREKNGHF